MILRTLFTKKAKSWPVWRTVELGTYRDAKAMKSAIENAGMYVSGWAEDILGKVSFARAKKTLDLVVVTVADLGFPEGATTKEILDAAKKQGLSICPAEVGPQLRLQYKDQPLGEWNFIAMQPIVDSVGDSMLFLVGRHDGKRWLSSGFGNPGLLWFSFYRFVFVLGK